MLGFINLVPDKYKGHFYKIGAFVWFGLTAILVVSGGYIFAIFTGLFAYFLYRGGKEWQTDD